MRSLAEIEHQFRNELGLRGTVGVLHTNTAAPIELAVAAMLWGWREAHMDAAESAHPHQARPDDDPEPGNRCKDCGKPITWIGSRSFDWQHCDEQEG